MTYITAGKTDVSLYVYFVDDDGGTAPGEPTTGLLFSDIETGGSASYVRQGAARTAVTLITLASASAAHADGGFILVDDVNMPGLYRLDLPDAVFARGVDLAIIQLRAADGKNTLMRPLEVMLETKQGYNAMADTKVLALDGTDPQTKFTLKNGPDDDNALLNAEMVAEQTSGDQSRRRITAYTGSTREVVIKSAFDHTLVTDENIRAYPVSDVEDGDTIVSKFYDKILSGNHDIAGSGGAILQVLRQISERTNNSNLDALLGIADASGADLRERLFDAAIPASPTANSVDERIKTLDDVTTDDIAIGLLDLANGVEPGLTVRECLVLMAAVLFGEVSGNENNNPKFRDTNDTKNRVVADTDAVGNRTAVTLDKT